MVQRRLGWSSIASADKREDDVAMVPQPRGSVQKGRKVMGPAEVARIADHEAVSESPFFAQSVAVRIDGQDGVTVGPVVDGYQRVRRDATMFQILSHALDRGDADGRSA